MLLQKMLQNWALKRTMADDFNSLLGARAIYPSRQVLFLLLFLAVLLIEKVEITKLFLFQVHALCRTVAGYQIFQMLRNFCCVRFVKTCSHCTVPFHCEGRVSTDFFPGSISLTGFVGIWPLAFSSVSFTGQLLFCFSFKSRSHLESECQNSR